MLLELAIGDAYGAAFEYASRAFIQEHNTLTGYHQNPRHPIPPGCYTDDTQMSIAIAELIVRAAPWTAATLADAFVAAFKRDPREGYAGRFYAFLQRVQSGAQFLAEIQPDSDKSGAAMRASPIGVFPSIAEVIARTRVQAALTHNTPDGINAAVAAALMTHYCLYRLGPKHALGRFIEQYVPGQWAVPWRGKVGQKGWMSVRAAITALVEQDRMSSLLRHCVDFSGDVDTVAAIALAAAACCPEVEQDLPAALIDGLEQGPYGRAYLLDLNRRLMTIKV